MNYKNLIYEIKRRGLSFEDFAKVVNIPIKHFLEVLKYGDDRLMYSDIKKICEYFNLRYSADYLFLK